MDLFYQTALLNGFLVASMSSFCLVYTYSCLKVSILSPALNIYLWKFLSTLDDQSLIIVNVLWVLKMGLGTVYDASLS